jgi:hypothetical protein
MGDMSADPEKADMRNAPPLNPFVAIIKVTIAIECNGYGVRE